MTNRSTRVTICVVTYLRPVGLGRLCDGLAALEVPDGLDVEVVVVDNDEAGTAAPVVENHPVCSRWPVHLSIERSRGITYARNRALRAALATGSEWIVWLDDDEVPHANWLTSVFDTQAETGADVVLGSSSPVFEASAPDWIVDTGAFDPPTFEHRSAYPYFYTRTSGVLHRSALAPDAGFDNRLALVGGEDRLFFTRMHRLGATFAWDAHAVVDEWIPTSKVSVGWLARRWFRTGVTRSLTLLILDDPSGVRRARRFAGGLLMAAGGVIKMVPAAVRGRTALLRSLRLVLLGVGASYGALGFRFKEYERIHGG